MSGRISPWNNVVWPPDDAAHPDLPGEYLNYYRNKMGQLVPLWPKCGPMKSDHEDE